MRDAPVDHTVSKVFAPTREEGMTYKTLYLACSDERNLCRRGRGAFDRDLCRAQMLRDASRRGFVSKTSNSSYFNGKVWVTRNLLIILDPEQRSNHNPVNIPAPPALSELPFVDWSDDQPALF